MGPVHCSDVGGVVCRNSIVASSVRRGQRLRAVASAAVLFHSPSCSVLRREATPKVPQVREAKVVGFLDRQRQWKG